MANLRKVTRRSARRYGLDPNIEERQINAESGYRPHALSPKGARGPAQLMPGTARELGVNPDNPVQNIKGGMKYMRQMLDRFHGNYRMALAAYNAGPGNTKAGLGYADKILNGRSPATSRVRSAVAKPSAPKAQAPDRRAALMNYLANDGQPDALLNLALSLHGQNSNTATAHPVNHQGARVSHSQVPSGTASFEGKQVAAWIKPWLSYARKHGWKGSVTSGFRSLADQTRIYNSGVRPAAKPGTSNHEGSAYPRGAVDVSDAQTLSRILQGARSPLKYAGAKDPVHFSHPHNGSY